MNEGAADLEQPTQAKSKWSKAMPNLLVIDDDRATLALAE